MKDSSSPSRELPQVRGEGSTVRDSKEVTSAMLLLRSRRSECQRILAAKRKLHRCLCVGRSRGAKLRAAVKVMTVPQLEAWLEENRKLIMSSSG